MSRGLLDEDCNPVHGVLGALEDALLGALSGSVVEHRQGLPEPSAEWERTFGTWVLEDGETGVAICLRAKDGSYQWVKITNTVAAQESEG